jgi:hypothetical protein
VREGLTGCDLNEGMKRGDKYGSPVWRRDEEIKYGG